MSYDKEIIRRKLKGCSGEQLFEMLHLELKCRVLRTGHEFLYPDLMDIANIRKAYHHKVTKESDIALWCKQRSSGFKLDPNLARKLIWDVRFRKSIIGTKLARSPDFTIITHSGNILQFEVKYRFDGLLTEEDKQKYLNGDTSPYLFVFSKQEPFIRILIPIETSHKELSHSYLKAKEAENEDYSNSLDKAHELLEKKYGGSIDEYSGKELEEWDKMTDSIYAERKIEWIYAELEREKDGSLKIPFQPDSDSLVYPVRILKKYGESIVDWFKD